MFVTDIMSQNNQELLQHTEGSVVEKGLIRMSSHLLLFYEPSRTFHEPNIHDTSANNMALIQNTAFIPLIQKRAKFYFLSS